MRDDVAAVIAEAEMELRDLLIGTARDELFHAVADSEPSGVALAVDGVEGADLDAAGPYGRITATFSYLGAAVAFAGQALRANSPVETGAYAARHALVIDGVAAGMLSEGADLSHLDELPAGSVVTIVNTAAYAGRIERGESREAPNGVYALSAETVRRAFGDVVAVSFAWIVPDGAASTTPHPALEIRRLPADA